MKEPAIVAGWKAEGWAEGWAEGLAKGELKGYRTVLIMLFEDRSEGPLPADLVVAIMAESDPERLARWVHKVGMRMTLGEFRAESGL